MARQPSDKQEKSNHAEQQADIEDGSTSQPGGAPEILKDDQYYRPLVQAAYSGDWEFAKRFFEKDPESKTAKITSRSETVLHTAALGAQDHFLENLVELLSAIPGALQMVDCEGRTALHYAVLCGRIRMVKALVRSDPKLTQLADNGGRFPFAMSVVEAYKHKEITWFLAENTTDEELIHIFSSPDAINIVRILTIAGHLDITLYLVGRHPDLIKRRSAEGNSILGVLAATPSHFLSGNTLGFLETLIYKIIPVDLNYKPTNKKSDPALQRLTRSLWNAAKIVVPTIKRAHEVKWRHVTAVELAKEICKKISYMKSTEIIDFMDGGDLLFQATAKGISEIIQLLIQFFPDLIWIRPRGKRLTTIAVEYRQERIVRLFLKLTSTAELSLVPEPTLHDSKSMMLAVASYENAHSLSLLYFDDVTDVAGAAFQTQRELQWYEAVQSWVNPDVSRGFHQATANEKHKTYWNIFLEEHRVMLKNGEKWAKNTANSCMVVSALIATVLFAAAFTMPGGNNSNNGVALLLGKDSLLIFIISDALGLFSSVTAILLFLAILTSRYEAQDFLESLPKKIIVGLSLLFLSLAFMLMTFTATLKIMLDKKLEWVFIPIVLLASLPVALFVILQLPLLYQMIRSTYGPSIFCPDGIWDGVKCIGSD